MHPEVPIPTDILALGIDAGGTETRWTLMKAPGEIVAEGHAPGLSALDLQGPGRPQAIALLEGLARDVLAAGRPLRVHAGLTGFGPASGELAHLLAELLALPEPAVTLSSDIETAYLDLFAPGEGYLVYAGTGSIAAFIDAGGTLHRAGGRGVLIDDGGGGYWIARRALRQVWRAEDERPGSWRDSPMAQELFALLGGSEWSHTRQRVYLGSRGGIGRLALAVARAAEHDPAAYAILRAAGGELARLARALIGRFGPRPVALGGRAATLHPVIAEVVREALPATVPFTLRSCRGEHAAARLALAAATGNPPTPIEDAEP